MKKRFSIVTRNGTVHSWKPRGMREILYPEQDVEVRGEQKRRGGAFVCCPIFGPMPNTPHYKGLSIPQHGLVRQHPFRDRVCRFKDGQATTNLWFQEPWPHAVYLNVKVLHEGSTLKHAITVRNTGQEDMPVSFGFHPYFATNGKPFEIRHRSRKIKSASFAPDEPLLLCLGKGKKVVTLFVDRVLITFTLEGYTHVCIWSDKPEKYICVEPVLKSKQGGELILPKGDSIRASCSLFMRRLHRS